MTASPDRAGPARLDVELDRPGRHFGQLHIPYSHDESAYGRISVPVAVLRGGTGPTLLLTAGIHGDEYEGQVALLRLAQTLDPAQLGGRMIIVPIANPPASDAARRTSPIDGVNLARSFPGRADGTPTEQIAEGLTRLLLPLADGLVDLHSGGRTLEYIPCAFGRLPADAGLAQRTLELMQAFGAPLTLVMTQPEASATFVQAALGRGIPAMATELGGGGGVAPAALAIAEAGLRNVLAFMGMLQGPAAPPSTRLMGIAPQHFVRAPGRGLFEPRLALGGAARAGEAAGYLWSTERPEHAPERLDFPSDGLVVCRRVPANCAKADVLMHLARDVTVDELLPDTSPQKGSHRP